ncbi:MAG TPA: TldD/PmbA family protein [Candidatus Angelobacter sp.]|jgi:predicted Zn-dependent protease|nr:TldD/PmbA family protein [Candidatus Angelobacter sp.]
MKRKICSLLLVLLCGFATSAQNKPTSSVVLSAAQAELSRSLDQLRKQPVPPYFLSYEITEVQGVDVAGTFGTLSHSGETRRRQLHIDLRVGDYRLDNTHQVRGGGAFPNFADRFAMVAVPIENDPDAIRAVLWYETDKRYKRAVEQLTTARTNSQVKVEQEDKSADFSREEPQTATEPIIPVAVDRKLWEEKVRKYTAPFKRYGDIYEAEASLSASRETRWFVSSDGSAIQTSGTYYRLFIYAFTKAEDGMELPRYESFFSFTPEGLPDDASILKTVDKMIADLKALKAAPVVDPYTGPAILSGRATGVFFHEVFGHRIEGHRQKNEEEAQTFKKMVGQPVLPDFLSVYFDPTQQRYGNTDLVGFYSFDNQGVKARRVTAVENGILKNFLMSRSPIDGFPSSNGHGRSQPGFVPVARQSNLQVVASKSVSRDQLKDMLIEQIKKQNKPFGLLFDDIQGGFTLTGRTIPNAFNVLPVMVYRVYPDKREELVRGVDLIGTPLTVFSKIVAADDQIGIFNGVCGAESGGVPVSAGGPAILVSQIEAQKKQKSQERSPILAAPFEDR